jgi:hypothetical protein
MGLAMGSLLARDEADPESLDRFYQRYVRYVDHN